MRKVEFAAGFVVRLVVHCNAHARDRRSSLGSLGAGEQASPGTSNVCNLSQATRPSNAKGRRKTGGPQNLQQI
jgi:hypothetical protein